MTRWIRAVAICATAFVLSVPSIRAADLDYRDEGPPRRFGSAYDDPRYADLYGDGPSGPSHAAPRYVDIPPPEHRPDYSPRYAYGGPPIPREPVYGERYREPPHRSIERHPGEREYARVPGCLGKEEARYRLEREGWQGFHDPRVIDQGVATVKARRPSGRVFQLQIDRCSGEIITARPIEPLHRPYADYDERPRYRY